MITSILLVLGSVLLLMGPPAETETITQKFICRVVEEKKICLTEEQWEELDKKEETNE